MTLPTGSLILANGTALGRSGREPEMGGSAPDMLLR